MTLSERPMDRQAWRLCGRTAAVALLILMGIGCSAVVKNVDHEVYSKPKYGTDRFVLVRDYNIHYVEVGEGEPVLLIPGAFTTYRTWNGVLLDLSSHYRVLAIDYVGVGDSDKPELGFHYTVEEQADVIAEMIGALRLSKVNVVGASYGGAVALNLAARYSDLVNKIVCVEGGALITPEALNYGKLGTLLEWPILGDIIWGFMKSGLFDRTTGRAMMGAAWEKLTAEERKEITGIVSANLKTASRSSWMSIYRVITDRIDFIQALEHTQVPILYVYGENSRYRAVVDMNVRNFEAHIPNIEIVSFKSGTHELHLQYPHDVARTILRFLGKGPGKRVVADGFDGPAIGSDASPGLVIH